MSVNLFFVVCSLSVSLYLSVLLTVAPASSIARTNATASEVQERTVSVRPSLNIRVMDDSYVKQNSPWSYKADRIMVVDSTIKHLKDNSVQYVSKVICEAERWMTAALTLNCASCSASWIKASGLVLHFLISPFPNSVNRQPWKSTSSAICLANKYEVSMASWH